MKRIDFNQGWYFSEEKTGRSYPVTLPHDAMINTERDPSMRNYFLLAGFCGGEYHYKKTFDVPEDARGKTIFLEFEAVYCMSEVYVNGEKQKEKPYGYTPFMIPLHDCLNYGAKNTVEVIAHVPYTDHGRWYTGGGIYRPVNLYVSGSRYLMPQGLTVTTKSVCPAVVRVEAAVSGGRTVAFKISRKGKTEAGGSARVCDGRASMEFTLENAALWSAETPNLYEVTASLSCEDAVVDSETTQFGIRTIAVDPKQGLLINNVPTFLRGGCIHNDCGVIGVINNDATELHRAKNIKASGFNAIRSAHHPMSRSLMKACDQIGLYVMDEAFDYWYRPKSGNPYGGVFMEEFREDAMAMARDAYNHPSVIMYSIGNEIPEAGGVKGVRVGKAILDAIHSVDVTRPCTLCPSVHWLREYLDGTPYLTVDEDEWMARSEENRQTDRNHYVRIFMGAVNNLPDSEKGQVYPDTYIRQDEEATKNLYPMLDVAGYNYYEDRYDVLHKLHPERVLLGTETRGNLIVDTMRYAKSHPFLIGDFVWTLQDHLGEANCCDLYYDTEDSDDPDSYENRKKYPWLVNYGGVLNLTGDLQPAIYRYRFAWDENHHGIYLASQPPVHNGCAPHVTSYRWTDTVEGWTYEGCEGNPTWVDVYTDASRVEVFVNGSHVGEADVTDYFARVLCTYQPGELTAVGYDESGSECCRTSVYTAGKETQIRVNADKTVLSADGNDFCFIDISITDDEGIVKLLPERRVSVCVEGPATLQGFGSAYHKNEERYNQTTHTTYMGRLQAVLRSGVKPGTVTVILSTEGLAEKRFTLQVEERQGQ